MKRIYLYTLLLSFIYFTYSCNKEDMNPHGLPAATESGENTFGCLINGEPWIAEIGPGVLTPTLHKIVANYDEENVGVSDNYGLSITAKYVNKQDSIKDILGIRLRPVYEAGEIDFSALQRNDITFVDGQLGAPTNNKHYELDTLYNNQFSITKLDTVNNICSGEIDVRLTHNQEILTISEGRFDIKYHPE